MGLLQDAFEKTVEKVDGKKKCEYCKDLDEMEREYPREVHKGARLYCDECKAEYYEEWGTEIMWATNEQALINHPELKKL